MNAATGVVGEFEDLGYYAAPRSAISRRDLATTFAKAPAVVDSVSSSQAIDSGKSVRWGSSKSGVRYSQSAITPVNVVGFVFNRSDETSSR
jgi:hypothetical protein